MDDQRIYTSEVTLCTGVKVKALIQGKNIFHAFKCLEWVYGVGRVGIVKERTAATTQMGMAKLMTATQRSL
jgi:hypothetical protein